MLRLQRSAEESRMSLEPLFQEFNARMQDLRMAGSNFDPRHRHRRDAAPGRERAAKLAWDKLEHESRNVDGFLHILQECTARTRQSLHAQMQIRRQALAVHWRFVDVARMMGRRSLLRVIATTVVCAWNWSRRFTPKVARGIITSH